MPEISVVGTTFVAEAANGQQSLAIDIQISCPECGTPSRFQIAGHHIRVVQELLAEVIAAHPDLVGKGSDRTVRSAWEGQVKAPERN